jgi:hypothetical protein
MKWRATKPKPAQAPPSHKEADLSGDEFLALCARADRGEVEIWKFGRGASNGRWWVRFREAAKKAVQLMLL